MISEDDDNLPINVLSTVNAKEPGGTANNGSFTVGWPTGISATGAVIIRVMITGTASGGTDYTAIPVTSITRRHQ